MTLNRRNISIITGAIEHCSMIPLFLCQNAKQISWQEIVSVETAIRELLGTETYELSAKELKEMPARELSLAGTARVEIPLPPERRWEEA